MSAEWHSFACSHRMGPADGRGGIIKRLAKTSLHRVYNGQIQTPVQLFDFCKENVKKSHSFMLLRNKS
jgi:hypothetical protein